MVRWVLWSEKYNTSVARQQDWQYPTKGETQPSGWYICKKGKATTFIKHTAASLEVGAKARTTDRLFCDIGKTSYLCSIPTPTRSNLHPEMVIHSRRQPILPSGSSSPACGCEIAICYGWWPWETSRLGRRHPGRSLFFCIHCDSLHKRAIAASPIMSYWIEPWHFQCVILIHFAESLLTLFSITILFCTTTLMVCYVDG